MQAHENFIFAKEEFLNGISIVLTFRIASHFGEISYLLFIFMIINCFYKYKNEILKTSDFVDIVRIIVFGIQ